MKKERRSTMAGLTTVEGIGETYRKKLKEAGVRTTTKLLENGATPKGRKEIAEMTGIADKLILRWVNHVDLFRIKGIGGEYAELLEAGGVDTVPELAQRNGENLFQKLETVNRDKKLVRKTPTQSQVSDWIEQAKQLPRIVTY
jgi:predicted flap endonuclease-1-like 5' DNA nuclease